jgi:hypothetical protein
MKKLIIAVLLFAFPSICFGATYYIDWGAANDSANGTTTSTPWKRCPGMPSFAGSYTHSAGDKFVFKGGVTWPAAAFTLTIANSGAVENPDIYTGGQLEGTPYGTGYPVFDGGGALAKNMIYASGKEYITINGISLVNMGTAEVPSTDKQIGFYGAVSGWTVTNCNFMPYGKDSIVIGAGTGNYSGLTIGNNAFIQCTNYIQISNGYGSNYNDIIINGNTFGDNYDISAIGGDHPDGIHFFPYGSVDNLKIYNNRFYGNWDSGTGQIYLSTKDKYTNVEIYNNIIGFDNTTPHPAGNYQFSPGQVILSNVRGLKFYNNTVSSDGSYANNQGTKYSLYLSGCSDVTSKNNIFSKSEFNVGFVNSAWTANATFYGSTPWGEYGAKLFPKTTWNNKLYAQSGYVTARKSHSTTEPTWPTATNGTVIDNGILWIRITYNAGYSNWVANTVYNAFPDFSTTPGDKVNPTTPNGYSYQAWLFVGVTGATEPNWASECPNQGDVCNSGDLQLTNLGTVITSDYNYYYPRAGEHAVLLPYVYASLTQWKAAPYSQDTHSLGNDATPPGFARVPPGIPALGDLRLNTGSPCIDTGTALGSPYNTDYDGNSRPSGSGWDIGAYEYGSGAPEPDTTPPVIVTTGPATALTCSGTASTTLTATTTDATNPVTCKYCENGVGGCSSSTDYDTMANTFTTTGGDSHSQSVTGLTCNSSFKYYVRCSDAATTPNKSTFSREINFTTLATVDTTKPTWTSATLGADGRTLTLVFSEAVVFGAGGNGGLTITPSGLAATVSYVSGSNSTTLVYYTSRIILATETLTSTYTQPGTGIQDQAGNILDTVSGKATTNNSTQTAAVLSGTTYSFWPADVTVGGDVGVTGYSGEFGVKFGSYVTGYITGIKFYKSATNTGTHVVNLWTINGVNLATKTVADETASGWQTQLFDTPVLISPYTTYVASYFGPSGHWTRTVSYFGATNFTAYPLYALASLLGTGYNGCAASSATSIYPNEGSGDGRNFWVDVLFSEPIYHHRGGSISGGSLH